MPFSKYDPERAIEPQREGTTASSNRRAKVLRWATWITWIWTAIGFGFIAFWLTQKP